MLASAKCCGRPATGCAPSTLRPCRHSASLARVCASLASGWLARARAATTLPTPSPTGLPTRSLPMAASPWPQGPAAKWKRFLPAAVWLLIGQAILARLRGGTEPLASLKSTLIGKITSTVGLTELVLVRQVGDGVEP